MRYLTGFSCKNSSITFNWSFVSQIRFWVPEVCFWGTTEFFPFPLPLVEIWVGRGGALTRAVVVVCALWEDCGVLGCWLIGVMLIGWELLSSVAFPDGFGTCGILKTSDNRDFFLAWTTGDLGIDSSEPWAPPCRVTPDNWGFGIFCCWMNWTESQKNT